MKMTTHVYGIKFPDKKWHEMKQIFDLCEKNKVPIPDEVNTYFGGKHPNEFEQIQHLGSLYDTSNNHDCVGLYRDDSSVGIEIDLEKLPKDMKILRFVNSW